MNTKYFPVIGLEIHVELSTKSKMFCQCKAEYFGMEPNSNTCPVCLGLPGALPVPNKQAILWTAKIAKALNCSINMTTRFDRKHYFYPDLPKGYQISQYDEPIGKNGYLNLAFKNKEGKVFEKKFDITRVHLEEDTGKLTHSQGDTLVDFNRSSVPLVEIVTEPCFENSEDVKTFLEELHAIIKTLGVSDADMEKGSMRLEPNISLSTEPDFHLRMKSLPKYKVEVKNINSFNFAKKAIDYELKRQAEILDKDETPPQETRGYNEDKGITYSQRSKENAQDYRYFPDPDIPPIKFSNIQIAEISNSIPELPVHKLKRFINDYSIKFDDAFILSRSVSTSDFFEKVLKELQKKDLLKLSPSVKNNLAQSVANAIINKKITSSNLSEFIKQFIEINTIVETDTVALEQEIEALISTSQNQVEQYKSGKIGILGFFIGQIMKKMQGKADPATVKAKIEEALNRR